MRIALAAALLVLVTGCGDAEKKAEPDATPTVTPTIKGVEVYTGLAKAHLKKGQYPQSYPQSPPVGGDHSPVWMACDVYRSELPKENAVHSLEHGAVWLTYQPGYAKEGLLVAMAQLNPEYVMVSPYEGQDTQVVATAWGLQLKVQDAGDPRVVAFVKQYAGGGQGGEKGVGCRTGGASLDKALAFDASQK